jgi:uncharacterized protein (TIGR02391 family)
MRITAGRKRLIGELAELLAGIAPATAMGKGFCVKRIADSKGLGKCWKDKSNKRKSIAAFLEAVFRKYPQKPKKVVLAIVAGGVEWSARRGRVVTRDELTAIATKMKELGFKVHKELAKLRLPDPSRVAPPPLDLAALIDRLDLHESLRDDCLTMFKNGHLNEAVRKALERFEKKSQDATGDQSIGKDLMGRTFSRNNPLIPINAGTAGNDPSEQEGFMHLTMGAMAGMRNLYSHGDVATMSSMDALERLAFVSLLFKRVDRALVTQGTTP